MGTVEKRITRSAAIRQKCLECSNDQPSEVRLCSCVKCPLFAYRMGREVKEGNDTQDDNTEEI